MIMRMTIGMRMIMVATMIIRIGMIMSMGMRMIMIGAHNGDFY